MQTVLIPMTMSEDCLGFDNEHAHAIGRYLSSAGYKVSYGRSDTSWQDYDIVYMSISKFDTESAYHQRYLSELWRSIANGKQERWVSNCDPCFGLLSLLKQFGRCDAEEYTHALRLPGQQSGPWPASEQFTKYRAIESTSIATAQAVYGNWWSCPDIAHLVHEAKLELQPTGLVYSGHSKADRMAALAAAEITPKYCETYEEFVKYYANSSAVLVLSSPGHNGAVTYRLMESLLLSICVYHDSSYVDGLVHSRNRVFSTKAELDIIMAEIHKQDSRERWAELGEQYDRYLDLKRRNSKVYYG